MDAFFPEASHINDDIFVGLTSENLSVRAIIIGGGIGGLTAAIALRRKGIEAQVYEKSPALRELGAGISLWPNAVKALRKLGLGSAIDSISVDSQDVALRRWDGAYISRTQSRELERRFGGGMIILHRAELLAALANEVGAENIHLGHAVTNIEENALGVSASFSNTVDGRSDILIGADGLHSFVRSWLGHDNPIRYSGYTSWRAVVSFDSSTIIPSETWGRGKRFGILPVKGSRVYWFATSNHPEGGHDSSEGPQAQLLSLYKGWHPPIEALIQATPSSSVIRTDISDRDPLTEWGRGRVTLLGDAAHPMTPNLGQGACQAIEDALELAQCLAHETNLEWALQNYSKKRIARTSSIVLASRRVGSLAQIESAAICQLRNIALRLTPRSVTYRNLAPVLGYEGHLTD